MVILSSKEKYILNDILAESFGSLDSYITLVDKFDLRRLTYNLNNLLILKSWDAYLDLNSLGQLPNTDIIFLDTKYREIKRFTYSPIFGEDNDHILWLNSLKHGSQIYLRISNLIESKCLLCVICTKLNKSIRKSIVKNWLTSIDWSNIINKSNTLYIEYLGEHNILIYYLRKNFEYTIDTQTILTNPATEIIEKTFLNQLTIYNLRDGYYIFQEVTTDNNTNNLTLNILSGATSENYMSLQDNLYYFGYQNRIQIALNAPNIYDSNINKRNKKSIITAKFN